MIIYNLGKIIILCLKGCHYFKLDTKIKEYTYLHISNVQSHICYNQYITSLRSLQIAQFVKHDYIFCILYLYMHINAYKYICIQILNVQGETTANVIKITCIHAPLMCRRVNGML